MTSSGLLNRFASRAVGAMAFLVTITPIAVLADTSPKTAPHSFSASLGAAKATVTYASLKFIKWGLIEGFSTSQGVIQVDPGSSGKPVTFHPQHFNFDFLNPDKPVIRLFKISGERYPLVAVITGRCGSRFCGYDSDYYHYSKGSYNRETVETLWTERDGLEYMKNTRVYESHEEVVRSVIPVLNGEYLIQSEFCGAKSLFIYHPGALTEARLVHVGDVLQVGERSFEQSEFVAYLRTKSGFDCIRE